MNNLLTWISTKLPIGTSLVYPNFSGKGQAPEYKGKSLLSFYYKTGFNPPHDAVNLYEAFRNYLDTSAEWEEIFRVPGSYLALIMWYVAEALRFFYVKLFELLHLTKIRHFAEEGDGYNGGRWGIHRLYYYSYKFGLIIFIVVLLLYVIGTTINSPTFQRYKNILRNSLLIIFFIAVLPTCVSWFATGVESVAQGMLLPAGHRMETYTPMDTGGDDPAGDEQNQLTNEKTRDDVSKNNRLARQDRRDPDSMLEPKNDDDSTVNDVFIRNVISVPIRIQDVQPGTNIFTDAGSAEAHRLHSSVPIAGLDTSAEPIYLDTGDMSKDQLNAWNGLETESVPEFLKGYMQPDVLMNADNIQTYADSASQIMSAKGKNPGGNQGKVQNEENDENKSYNIKSDIPGPNWFKNAFATASSVSGPAPTVAHWIYRFGRKHFWDPHEINVNEGDYQNDFKTLFSYHVASTGTGAGLPEAEQGLASHSLEQLDGTKNNISNSTIGKPFLRSYSYYHVNWLAIYAQLSMLILITGAFIFKLLRMIFKMVVMYIASGIVLFRNVDNYQRIKNWMRDFFSIYEMALMDTIMIYVAMNIIYPSYHYFNNSVMVNTNNVYLANTYSIAIVDLLCDIALYYGALKGVNAVNSMAGSQGGGANSGAGTTFGSIIGGGIALRTASMVGRTGMNMGKKAITAPVGMAWGAGRRHHRDGLLAKKLANVKGDQKSNSANSNRNHNKPGFNSDKKKHQHGANGSKTIGPNHNSSQRTANGRTPSGKPTNKDKNPSQTSDHKNLKGDKNSNGALKKNGQYTKDGKPVTKNGQKNGPKDSDVKTKDGKNPQGQNPGGPKGKAQEDRKQDDQPYNSDDYQNGDGPQDDDPESQKDSDDDQSTVLNSETDSSGDSGAFSSLDSDSEQSDSYSSDEQSLGSSYAPSASQESSGQHRFTNPDSGQSFGISEHQMNKLGDFSKHHQFGVDSKFWGNGGNSKGGSHKSSGPKFKGAKFHGPKFGGPKPKHKK